EGEDGAGYGVFRRGFNLHTGAPGTAAGLVNTLTTGSQAHPRVATVNYGGDVITWDDDTNDPQGGVFGRLHGGGPAGCFGQSGVEYRINTTTTGSQSGPAIAYGGFLGGGWALMIAWTSEQDPDGSTGIYAEISPESWLPVELQAFTVE